MRIAYASTFDIDDIRRWSGTGHFIGRGLRGDGIALDILRPPYTAQRYACGLKKQFYVRMLRKGYIVDRDPLFLRSHARRIKRHLNHNPTDIVFSPGSQGVSQLDCQQPIVFWADATFDGLLNSYSEFTDLCAETITTGHAMEFEALKRSRLAIYASEWAANSAINVYGADPDKVHVVPFGANLTSEWSLEQIRHAVRSRDARECQLLFIGVDWKRKGGDLAVQVTEELNMLQVPAKLLIVGCEPPREVRDLPYVRCLGFIDKSTPSGARQLGYILLASHFLLVPSRAECFGIVFCEAAACGVPSISTATGGIPSAVADDGSGKLFSPADSAFTYAQYIQKLFYDRQLYEDLALSAYDHHCGTLNWRSASDRVKALLRGL